METILCITECKFLGACLPGCNFIDGGKLVMFSEYGWDEISGIDTKPYLVRFHYGQHAGYPLRGLCYRYKHFTFNQVVKFCFDGLSQGHWYSSWSVDTRRNISVEDDLILSWQHP